MNWSYLVGAMYGALIILNVLDLAKAVKRNGWGDTVSLIHILLVILWATPLALYTTGVLS